jgi:hypothetical protein
LLVYSPRARHYSFDSLSTIILLFFYIKFFSKKIETKYLIIFLSLALVLFLGSFTSIIIAGILAHILFFRIIKEYLENYKSRPFYAKLSLVWLNLWRVKKILFIIIFDILAVFIYFNLLKTYVGLNIYEYWNNFFIDIHQSFLNIFLDIFGKIVFFIMEPFWSVGEFFANTVGEYIFLVLLLVILFFGMIYLYKNKLFGILFFIGSFYIVAVFLSVLKLYPLSGGRVDIYSYPITILLGVCGIWQVVVFSKFDRTLKVIFFVYLYSMFFALSFFYFTGIQYPYKINIKNYVGIIEQNATENDAILISPHSDYAFAYYTDWPIRFEKNIGSTGFVPVIAGNNVFALPPKGLFNVDTQSVKDYMEYFLSKADNFDKIYFFHSHCLAEDKKYKDYAYRKYISEKIIENNFKLISLMEGENACFLKIYQRNDIL